LFAGWTWHRSSTADIASEIQQAQIIDGLLAVAMWLGLALNAALGWWWADPAAGSSLSPTQSKKPAPSVARREAAQNFWG
jgi:hypothetical protein